MAKVGVLFLSFWLAACVSTPSVPSSDREPAAAKKSFDGFPIDSLIASPTNIPKDQVRAVVVFAHGSGPIDMNGAMTEGTQGEPIAFYKMLSDVFLTRGMATVRYNKRAYEMKKRFEADPRFKETPEFKRFWTNPLAITIRDYDYFVDLAHREFPKAKVILLGHSEGVTVALNVAAQNPFISGVALIGYTNNSIATSLVEQFIYRNAPFFARLDLNRDGILDQRELSSSQEWARLLHRQMQIIDRDESGTISFSEFKAAQYSNLLVDDRLMPRNYMMDEAHLLRNSDLLKFSTAKVLFLQGEWDNQTPLYQTQAIQIVNHSLWKKSNFRFVIFPKLGHILDPQQTPDDITYEKPAPETLDKVAEEVKNFLL